MGSQEYYTTSLHNNEFISISVEAVPSRPKRSLTSIRTAFICVLLLAATLQSGSFVQQLAENALTPPIGGSKLIPRDRVVFTEAEMPRFVQMQICPYENWSEGFGVFVRVPAQVTYFNSSLLTPLQPSTSRIFSVPLVLTTFSCD